jgi:hypothetical protein
MTYGPGQPLRKAQLEAHRKTGGRLVLWDVGYFAQDRAPGTFRLSVDEGHPQHLLDYAPADSARWNAMGIPMRHVHDPKGPIILVGLGPKTRAIIPDTNWEIVMYSRLRRRFPRHTIIFRPKPRRPHPQVPCHTDGTTPIATLLEGASLVVCRHSNVAVDAVVAGVPFEASDGAAKWLDGKPYTFDNRLEFLQRLMWFNWRAEEARQAWGMILKCLSMKGKQ